MRQIIVAVVLALVTVPASAIDFLGVELCADRVDTGVILPAESPLSLESAEVGRHGGLVLLLHSKKGTVLDEVDDLMEPFVGSRGVGDERKLEWTGDEVTGFAQVIKKGYVALAITATEDCTVEAEDKPEATAAETDPASNEESIAAEEAPPVAAAAVVETEHEAAPEITQTAAADFELKGKLKHAAAEDERVDVMGVVINGSGDSFVVASFDLSLYDATGDLICVDTISVNHLKDGQERAFRGAIRCADYDPGEVAAWKLQFAGGH